MGRAASDACFEVVDSRRHRAAAVEVLGSWWIPPPALAMSSRARANSIESEPCRRRHLGGEDARLGVSPCTPAATPQQRSFGDAFQRSLCSGASGLLFGWNATLSGPKPIGCEVPSKAELCAPMPYFAELPNNPLCGLRIYPSAQISLVTPWAMAPQRSRRGSRLPRERLDRQSRSTGNPGLPEAAFQKRLRRNH